jgi:hypothetical protein
MSTQLQQQSFDKKSLPEELKSLPIFKVLGDKINANSNTTATTTSKENKSLPAIVFWSLIAAGTYFFIKFLPVLVLTLGNLLVFGVFAILLITLILLAPKIITFLHTLGKTILFKSEKELIKRNPIETLQMLNNDAKDTMKRVKEKISNVDGVRINMITDAEKSKQETEQKYQQVVKLTAYAGELDKEAAVQSQTGNTEKANALKREANEVRITATLRKQEGEASEQNARQYAQYGNQFSKVLEVLKDNESAARIYVNALSSSINIIDKKMEATKKMRNATEGLADVFNVEESWKFQEAMNAATGAISNNIASIRSNLEFLDQNNNVSVGTASQSELETFVTQVNSGRLQSLNVGEITDSNYDLTTEQKVDKTFNLLD